jgi:LPS-assembly lipoprotein
MSSSDFPRFARLLMALAVAGLTAGCFQPLYGDRASVGTAPGAVGGIADKMRSVDVLPVVANVPGRLPRVGGEIRNALIFDLTGGGDANTTAYTLKITVSSTNLQIISDVNTARPDQQNYGIDAYYTLTEVGTGKPLFSGSTFSRVSYDTPGQEQRFAGLRGLRDAENRAAKVISENIRNRLASHFAAGT